MVKQVRLDDELFYQLVRLKGFLEMKDGVPMSMGDMVRELFDKYPKQKLFITEDDPLFKDEGPHPS
jgi:hypothetical protein